MRHPMTLALTLLLAAPVAAQTATPPTAPATAPAQAAPAQPAGTVQDIVIVGTSELLVEFLRATLSVQPGTPLSAVNPRTVEQEVLASGYFKTAVAELRTVSGRDLLYVTVTPNPTISKVEVTGLSFLPADAFKASIADLLNIAPGATLNTERLEQAKDALASNFRSEGYPFQPSISSTTTANTDGSVTVNFVVDESAPLSRVEVSGATLLPRSTVVDIFKPLYDAKKFTPQAYFQAVQAVSQAYSDAGILQAGVNPTTTTLENGVLKVEVVEGKVTGVDLSNLNVTNADALAASLQTRVGRPVTLSAIQADVRTLSNQTGKAVGFAMQPDPTNPGQVTVLFGAADIATGPIKSIAVQGNTLIPTAQLLAAVNTKIGDTYSPQLAQQDFIAIRDVYRKAGYEVSTRDAITFQEGQLTFNIREVRVAKYEIQWQGKHNTKDRVITRELPPVGQAFNSTTLREALGRVSRLGFVRPVDLTTRSDDPQNPENITAVIVLAESDSGIPVNLAVGYDSLSGGWSGEAGYSNENVFGLAHKFGANLIIQQNEAGQNFAGNVSYSIPWLDFDFLDFRTVPTSLSVAAGTTVTGNNTLTKKATEDGVDPATGRDIKTGDNVDTYWDYTQRNTYFSVSAGRVLRPNLRGSVGIGVSYRTYYLEPFRDSDVPNAQGTETKVPVTTSEAEAQGLLPPESLTTNLTASLDYDSTNSPEFPTQGWRANTGVVYSFGRSGEQPVSWTELQGGASTYFGFGNTLVKEGGVTRKQQVFAVRANAGTLFGTYPEGTGFAVGGGSSPVAARQIRGIADGSLTGTNYFTTSAEYRYDFGLNYSVAQGLYGVVFADAGSAWGNATNPNFNLNYGFGAGLQLDLGFGGARLPSLRFDYGYSPQNGSGKFYFRLGNFW